MLQKFSSILDYAKPGLDPAVWGSDGKLLPEHKEAILTRLDENLKKANLNNFAKWAESIHIVGSLTTYQYTSKTDFDIHIYVDLPEFIESENPKGDPEDFLDNIRKSDFTDPTFVLPGTKHPIEYYFVTPRSSDDTSHVGIYDLLTDEWVKDPVSIGVDFDIEESKPKWIEEAAKMAADIDTSIGDIRRQVMRIEELQETIKAWDSKHKKLFKDKLEQKLEQIESEITELIDTKVKMVQERHSKDFDPQSEHEVRFKYLQKFGYFFLISQLKDLLEVSETEIAVTEDKIPEIKEIVQTTKEAQATDDHATKLFIDFDNTIAANDKEHNIGDLLPGAKEALDKLKAEGWEIIIYSVRANSPEGESEIREFMKENDLPYDEIFVGKPLGAYYIDDRNIVFTDWKDVLKTVEKGTNKEAALDTKYWVTPDGELIPLKDHTHLSWIMENFKDPRIYGFTRSKINEHGEIYSQDANDIASSMIRADWVRVTTDEGDNQFGIEVYDLDSIPPTVDAIIDKFFNPHDGRPIMIESIGGGDVATISDPFPSIQEAVNADTRKLYLEPASSPKKAQQAVKYDFSSTQFNMPKDITQKILEWSVENIPNEDLYDDETKRYGRELESHVTVLYGLLTNDSAEVEEALKGEKPVKIKFGKTKYFETETGDAINIEVESEDLAKLHDKLAKIKHESMHDEYHPHVTIAYVKDGLGKKYSGKDVLDGLEVTLDSLKFSPKEGDPKFIEVGSNKKEAGFGGTESWWVSPNGESYEAYPSHADWTRAHFKELGLKMPNATKPLPEDAEEGILHQMLKKGWTRVFISEGDEMAIQIFDINNPPSAMNDFFASKQADMDSVNVEDIKRNYVSLPETVETFHDAVLKELRLTPKNDHTSALKVTTKPLPKPDKLMLVEDAFISPDNKFYAMHGHSHSTWAHMYFDTEYPSLLNDGWIRVAALPQELYFELRSISPNQLDTAEDLFYMHSKNPVVWDLGGKNSFEMTDTDLLQTGLSFSEFVSKRIRKRGAFMPSIVQAPDNHWTPDSDLELAVKPDPISDEQTYFAPQADKPRKSFWQKLLDLLTGSIKEAAVAIGSEIWFDPNGKMYKVRDTHKAWIVYNRQLLREKYGINNGWVEQIGTYDDLEKPFQEMLKQGWVRVGSVNKASEAAGFQFVMQVYDVNSIPDFMNDFVVQNWNPNLKNEYGVPGIAIDNFDGSDDIIIDNPFPTLQKAVRKTMREWSKAASKLSKNDKKASIGGSAWVDPSGKTYEFPVELTHSGWIRKNTSMLQKKYNFTNVGIQPNDATYSDKMIFKMLESGWVRVNGYQGSYEATEFSIQVDDLMNPPDSLQAFLDNHYDWEKGDPVLMDDMNGRYAEVDVTGDVKDDIRRGIRKDRVAKLGKHYHPKSAPPKSTTWDSLEQDNEPFKPLPVTYSPETNDNNLGSRYPYRFMRRPVGPNYSDEGAMLDILEHPDEKEASVEKKADVITDILGLVKSTGGATWNFSQSKSLAGTENYAVSIYPEHTQIVDVELTPHILYTYITENKALLLKPENSLGIWKNGNQYYLDVTLTIPDVEQAKELGRKHNQIAIFDLKNFVEIPTGGTGEVQSKQATLDYKFWIAPSGEFYKVHGIHLDWVKQHWNDLGFDKFYNVSQEEAQSDDDIADQAYDLMIRDKGWARVTLDPDRHQFLITVGDIMTLPSSIEPFIERFFDPNEQKPIWINDYNDRNVTLDDPIGNLQEKVKQELRYSIPHAASLRLSKKEATLDFRSGPEYRRAITLLYSLDEDQLLNRNYIVQLLDIKQMPNAANDIKMMTDLEWEDFIVNNLELDASKKEAAAGMGVGYWISPQGKMFTLEEHLKLLKEKPEMFGLKPQQIPAVYAQGYAPLLNKGWVRVREYGQFLYLNAANLESAQKAEDIVYKLLPSLKAFTVSFSDGESFSCKSKAFLQDGWDALSRDVPGATASMLPSEELYNEAGSYSSTYTDEQGEEFYNEQHEMHDDQGGGNVYHDYNDDSRDYPKTPTKQKVFLDRLTTPPNGVIPSYEVTWYFGQPADDNGSM